MNSRSRIAKLGSFDGNEGISRVEERIQRKVSTRNEMQLPIMLEKPCRIAKIEVRWCHEQIADAG